jgi:hypothetical protein
MERSKYLVHVGDALPGQPTVRLELNDGTGRAHNFLRRKREKLANGTVAWRRVPDAPWVVDLTAKKAGELEDCGYRVVPADAPETTEAPKRRRKE